MTNKDPFLLLLSVIRPPPRPPTPCTAGKHLSAFSLQAFGEAAGDPRGCPASQCRPVLDREGTPAAWQRRFLSREGDNAQE